MKKWIFRTAAAFVATVLFTCSVYCAPTTGARSAILMDADTGRVLYAQSIDRRSLIASTTKIMTAVVVLEHCDPNQEFTVPVEATNVEGSSIYLQEGETLTIRELLYGLLLHSGNDAAVALAMACSGSVPQFVFLMNEQAKKLNLENSHFANPNGLDAQDHYSTASDLANLTRYALRNPEFEKLVSTKTIQIGNRHFSNHNKLLWSVEGAIGVKTGYTKAAGRILVSAARRNGRTLIAVTINDGNDWRDHAALYDYGFSQYTEQTVVRAGLPVGTIPHISGRELPVTVDKDVVFPMLTGEETKIQILYPKLAFSAVISGDFAGKGNVLLGDKVIAEIPLFWAEEATNEGAATKNNSIPWSSFQTGS